MIGVVDFSFIETTPGAKADGLPLALVPPADFAGGNREYAELIFARYSTDRIAQQQIALACRFIPTGKIQARIVGPFAEILPRILARITIVANQEQQYADRPEYENAAA